MTPCAVETCDRPRYKRQWCNAHYIRWRRHGHPLAGRPSWSDFTVPVEKACRRCGESKPLDEFGTRSSARDGKSAWCKACFTAHYHTLSDKRSAYRRQWAAANPDYFHDHYLENREHRIRLSAEYARRTGRKHQIARRLGVRAATVEVVLASEVYRRHGGICGICHDPVNESAFHVDHIIPIARGGEHSYANTQPAHPVCNMRKGARLAA